MTKQEIFDNIDSYEGRTDELVQTLMQFDIFNCDQFDAELQGSGNTITNELYNEVWAAYEKLDDAAWNAAVALNTAGAYQQYLDEHEFGVHRDEARAAIYKLEDDLEQAETDDWEAVDKDDIAALEAFCRAYPRNVHCAEAKKLIDQLHRDQILGVDITTLSAEMKRIETDVLITDKAGEIYKLIASRLKSGKITAEQILAALAADHNYLTSGVAHKLYKNNLITDFTSSGIDERYLKAMMLDNKSEKFDKPERVLDHVCMVPSTEVYFWGIPSSGKTCALGSILSVFDDGSTVYHMDENNKCQGYDYMSRLKALFMKPEVITLPGGTPVDATYELAFDIEDNNHLHHPITCIDLAGEMLRIMCDYDADPSKLTIEERNALEIVTNLLVDKRTDNQKIHFFVIEYGGEDRTYRGRSQRQLLTAGYNYIKSHDVFKENTDGVYILITKADKANAEGAELNAILKDYMETNYKSFYHGLKTVCRKHYINDGKVNVYPFSIGEVCFENFCNHDPSAAQAIVKLIVSRAFGEKRNIITSIMRKLRK